LASGRSPDFGFGSLHRKHASLEPKTLTPQDGHGQSGRVAAMALPLAVDEVAAAAFFGFDEKTMSLSAAAVAFLPCYTSG
jgi:hypothetical protein